ncbi:MAG TPA: methyltransferase domain-containing protein [Gammaproteobacteria bacterium]|nr:methyltransferase domain-containing protein [Gammaproteobacteria bacterium]
MKLEENSFWFQHRNNLLHSVIQRFPFQQNFVDIGGGNGFQIAYLAKKYPDRKFFLVEPGYEGCLNAKFRGLQQIYNIPFQDFPFAHNSIGAVGLFDVLEHIEDDQKALNELSSMLQTGTMIYVTVPAYNILWSKADNQAGHFRRYTLKSLIKLANQSGLKPIYSSYFFFYLPPITFSLRTLPYRLGIGKLLSEEKKFANNIQEHNPAALINRFFNKLNHWELNRIRNSKISFGASCIALFKKIV